MNIYLHPNHYSHHRYYSHYLHPDHLHLHNQLNNKKKNQKLKTFLQSILNQEIKTEKVVSFEMVTDAELKLKCPFVQGGLPPGKPLRVVNIESFFPMACGGTHVQRLNEIPMLRITKVKSSKDNIRISYSCFN